MTKAQEHCQNAGLPNMKVEVATSNTRAQRFYERLGFGVRQVEMFKKIKAQKRLPSNRKIARGTKSTKGGNAPGK